MKRATITLPDDLEAELNRDLAAKDAPPSLTAVVVEVALRNYLQDAALAARGYRPPSQPFDPKPIKEKDDAGESDVSENHASYLRKS